MYYCLKFLTQVTDRVKKLAFEKIQDFRIFHKFLVHSSISNPTELNEHSENKSIAGLRIPQSAAIAGSVNV